MGALAAAGFAFAAVDELVGRGVLSTPGFARTGVRDGAVERFVGVRDAIGLVVSRGTGVITAPGTGRCPTTGGGGVPGFGVGAGRGAMAPGVGGAMPTGVFADGGLAGGGGGTPIGREESRATGAGTALGLEGSRATGTGFDLA